MPETEPRKTTAVKSTEAARKVRRMMKEFYARGHQAKEAGVPVAWTTPVRWGLREIMESFGLAVVYPEQYSALLAAKAVALPYLEKAEADGFSHDVCGYARACIGYTIRRKELGMIPPEAPEHGMPDPDIIVTSSWACEGRHKWFQAQSRYLDVPYHVVEMILPPAEVTEAEKEYYVAYQVTEFREVVAFVERHLGLKLDIDRLDAVVKAREETRRIWKECYELRQAIPSPMPSEDMLSCQFPGMFMGSEKEAQDFYRELKQELQYRVANRLGVIPEEKYRLMFSYALPPWHHMDIFNHFESCGAVCVVEFPYYYEVYIPEVEVNVSDPIERMVRTAYEGALLSARRARQIFGHTKIHPAYGYDMCEIMLETAKAYQVDAVVVHFPKSCRVTSLGNVHCARVLREHAGIPAIFLESDIIDARDYAEAQTKARITASLETLAAARTSNSD